MTLGVAIIGCGDMGRKHAAAWMAQDGAQVRTVCDIDAGRAAAMASLTGAVAYHDWREAVAADGIDAVSVCIPACDHPVVSIASANLGRHVLCEKAMALTLDAADTMIAAAARNDVQLLVCHQYRGLSRFATMKREIEAGRIGWPIYMRFVEMREVRPKLAMHERGQNGGPLHDMTGHLFDLARYFTGAEALSVQAHGTVFGQGKPRLSPVADFGIDTAEILVRFEGGHVLSIGLNWGLPEHTPGYGRDLVHGPLGLMTSDDPERPDRFVGDISATAGVRIRDQNGAEWIAAEADEDGPHNCVRELVRAIRTGEASQFDGREGRAALRLIRAALESIETGAQVTLR